MLQSPGCSLQVAVVARPSAALVLPDQKPRSSGAESCGGVVHGVIRRLSRSPPSHTPHGLRCITQETLRPHPRSTLPASYSHEDPLGPRLAAFTAPERKSCADFSASQALGSAAGYSSGRQREAPGPSHEDSVCDFEEAGTRRPWHSPRAPSSTEIIALPGSPGLGRVHGRTSGLKPEVHCSIPSSSSGPKLQVWGT